MKANTIHILSLITFILVGCKSDQSEKVSISDLEVEVINNTIFELTPNHPAELPIVHVYSENEDINTFRFDSVKAKNRRDIDSLGLEIWLYNKLIIPDSNLLCFIRQHNDEYKSISFSRLKTREVPEKAYTSKTPIRVVKKSMYEEMKVNTIGFVKYSRFIFTPNKDTVKFIYQFSGEGCTEGSFKLVTASKNKEKWEIIKNVH